MLQGIHCIVTESVLGDLNDCLLKISIVQVFGLTRSAFCEILDSVSTS